MILFYINYVYNILLLPQPQKDYRRIDVISSPQGELDGLEKEQRRKQHGQTTNYPPETRLGRL